MLHKPRTVDAAMSLAVMHEEVLEASSKKYTPKSSRDYHIYHNKSGWSNDKGLLEILQYWIISQILNLCTMTRLLISGQISNLSVMLEVNVSSVEQNGVPTTNVRRLYPFMSWKSCLRSFN
jgi:hypothetical protein